MIFVDTAGWIALVHRRDSLHNQAVMVYKDIKNEKKITSDAMLLETCNAFSRSDMRHIAESFMEQIKNAEKKGLLEIIKISGEIFEKGWHIFKSYNDKNWGLTDCTSFAIMREKKIKEAFTSDHHFIQAGFEKLL